MAHGLRIDALKSIAEAAGVAMAPGSDQFEGEPEAFIPEALIVDISKAAPQVPMDAGNYSRSWARPLFRDTFPEKPAKANYIKLWLTGRRSRIVPT